MATSYITPEARKAQQMESLNRAVTGQSLANYAAIFEGFMERGIPESEIKPRENVFTFNAWKALGRHVRKGEHGVKVLTWITAKGKETQDENEAASGFRFCKSSTVFHITQTEVN